MTRRRPAALSVGDALLRVRLVVEASMGRASAADARRILRELELEVAEACRLVGTRRDGWTAWVRAFAGDPRISRERILEARLLARQAMQRAREARQPRSRVEVVELGGRRRQVLIETPA